MVQVTCEMTKNAAMHIRGVIQKYAENKSPFLHRLINGAETFAHMTATHMQLIGHHIIYVSCLRTLQLSSRQRYIA